MNWTCFYLKRKYNSRRTSAAVCTIGPTQQNPKNSKASKYRQQNPKNSTASQYVEIKLPLFWIAAFLSTKVFNVVSFSVKKEEVSGRIENFLRASVAAGAKIMLFCHTKCLLYYFTTSFYNISFIRCFIIQFYTLKQYLLHIKIHYFGLPHLFVPLQICNGTDTKWYMCQIYATYATYARELFFVFGVGALIVL